MKTTLQIEITSDKQKKKIHKAEKLLQEAGIKFDKETDIERNVREWQFEKIEGAKLLVEQDTKLSMFMRIHSLKHKIDHAEITEPDKLEEANKEIARLERELEVY